MLSFSAAVDGEAAKEEEEEEEEEDVEGPGVRAGLDVRDLLLSVRPPGGR